VARAFDGTAPESEEEKVDDSRFSV
jgi:hypothetical protein